VTLLEPATDPNVLLHPRTIREGFTQSELTEFGKCHQKWNWRYNHLLEKAGTFNLPFMVGSAFHDVMEQFYNTKGERFTVATLQFEEGVIPSLQDQVDLDYWNHVLPAMVRAYAVYYKGDHAKWKIHSFEEEIEIVYRGFRLRGKIDLTLEDDTGIYTLDHKTSSRLNKDVVAGWDFRFQFLFYLWLKSKTVLPFPLKGYYINAVKKPELRVKKTESIPEFAQRVFEDMVVEPDKYFYRDRLPIDQATLDHFERTVVNHRLRLFEAVLDPSTPLDLAQAIVQDKNTDECQHYNGPPCPYLELCRHGYQKMSFLYTRKENKHMELDNE
jgi:hypothetical protein